MAEQAPAETRSLRLVQPADASSPQPLPGDNTRTGADDGPRMSRSDPRWVLAALVALAAEPTTGTLGPAQRDRLVRHARRLGLREFDAHLVIAIVQDSIRRGAGALGPGVAARVSLIDPPQPAASRGLSPAGHWWLSIALAAAVFATLVHWIVS